MNKRNLILLFISLILFTICIILNRINDIPDYYDVVPPIGLSISVPLELKNGKVDKNNKYIIFKIEKDTKQEFEFSLFNSNMFDVSYEAKIFLKNEDHKMKIKNSINTMINAHSFVNNTISISDASVNNEIVIEITKVTRLLDKNILSDPKKIPQYKTTEDKKDNSLYNFLRKQSTASSLALDYKIVANKNVDGTVYLLEETKNDKYPVYFYRGAVNNRLIMDNICYRIIRTTSTGGVRIIYDGPAKNGACNNNGNNTMIGRGAFNLNTSDNAYIGYMYGYINRKSYIETHINKYDSNVKSIVDEWFKDTILNSPTNDYLDYNAVYCNDRTINDSALFNINETNINPFTTLGYGNTNSTIYKSYGRVGYYVAQSIPSLECFVNDSFSVNKGNQKLTYPVGLITADEVVLAGGHGGYRGDNYYINPYYNTDYYLYNGTWYWTMSPAYYSYTLWNIWDAYMQTVNEHGVLMDSAVDNQYGGIRPVLTLSHKVKFASGKGTASNPYRVSLK